MPTLIQPLQAEGAVTDVSVGWSTARVQLTRAALRPVPPSVILRALVDTGAETTCLDGSLIRALGLPVAGTVIVNLPAHGGVIGGILYEASLTILHPSGKARDHFVVQHVLMLDIALASLGYQAVIGRDVLKQCRFVYDGPADRFELHY